MFEADCETDCEADAEADADGVIDVSQFGSGDRATPKKLMPGEAVAMVNDAEAPAVRTPRSCEPSAVVPNSIDASCVTASAYEADGVGPPSQSRVAA